MTPNTTKIQNLIDAVESRTAEYKQFDDVFDHTLEQEYQYAREAYCGSMDAAIALKDKLLPEYKWGRLWAGFMWVEFNGRRYECIGDARGLLVAVLKAYKHEVTK